MPLLSTHWISNNGNHHCIYTFVLGGGLLAVRVVVTTRDTVVFNTHATDYTLRSQLVCCRLLI
jgi:hypothetical protein